MTLLDLAKMQDAAQSLHGLDEPLVWVVSPYMFEQLKAAVAATFLDRRPLTEIDRVQGYHIVIRKNADPRFIYLMREKDVPPEEV